MNSNQTQQYSIRRNRQVIFIETLRELIERKKIRTPYNLVRQSAILRFLLIDGSNFYNEINKSFKLKLGVGIKKEFSLASGISSSNFGGGSFQIYIYKVDYSENIIKIPAFLKLPAFTIQDNTLKNYIDANHIKEEYCIQDIIKLLANAHGGVHFETWENIDYSLMVEPNSPFNINTNSRLYDIIEYTTDYVLAVLEPLAIQVQANVYRTKPISIEISQTFQVKNKTDEF
jgi:hypothetical protein